MNTNNSINNNGISQKKNIKFFNYCNLPPIVRLFFLIKFPKHYFKIHYPKNHLAKYIENYTKKINKVNKYPIIGYYKNLKTN